MVLYKFVLEEYGAQYVEIAFGIIMMLVWSVNSWDFLPMVCIIICPKLCPLGILIFIGSQAISSISYADYYDPTFYTGLNCTGTEDHLFDCPVNDNAPACSSTGADANVICPGESVVFFMRDIIYFNF